MTVTVISIGGRDASPTGLFTTHLQRGGIRGRTADRDNASFLLSGRGGRYTGSSNAPRQVTLEHRITGPLESTLELLEGWFYAPHLPDAVAVNGYEILFEENGIEKTARGVPVSLAEHSSNTDGEGDCGENGWYVGTWLLLEPVYYAADQTVTTGMTTATVTDFSASVLGTVATERAAYTLTPTAQKADTDGQQLRRLITVTNREARPLIGRPLLVTPGGWDHRAEVTGLTSRADGFDVEVYAAGRRVMRWSDNWNDPATKIWVSADMPPGRAWTVKLEAAPGVTTLDILEPLSNLPGQSFYLVTDPITVPGGPMVLRVTAVNDSAGIFTVQRGLRDTSDLSIPAGGRVWWVPASGLIDLVWGMDPTGVGFPAPDYVDDRLKPMIGLTASSNIKHVYTQYYECVAAGNIAARHPRGAAWMLRSLGQYDREHYSGDGDMYWRFVPRAAGSPATFIGLDYRSLGAAAGLPLCDRWDLDSPIGISSVLFTWTCDLIRYGYIGLAGEIKRGRLKAVLIDADGNELVGGQYDNSVGGGTGAVTLTPGSPVYTVSFRIEPFDLKLLDPLVTGAGYALEPPNGRAWEVSSVTVNFAADLAPIVVMSSAVHSIYQFGRPDSPATLSTSAGVALLGGIIVDVETGLALDAYDQSARRVLDDLPLSHLVRGRIPAIPPDLAVYPSGGTGTVTLTDLGAAVGVRIGITHRDAWN